MRHLKNSSCKYIKEVLGRPLTGLEVEGGILEKVREEGVGKG